MDSITIRVTRPLCMNAERIEAGATLKLPALAAADVLASGRCALVHADDRVLIEQAVRADVKALLRKSGATQAAPPDGWPWQPR